MKLKNLFADCLAVALSGLACGCGLLTDLEDGTQSNSLQETSVTYTLSKTEGNVVIAVTGNTSTVEITLLEVMQEMQNKGELSYQMDDGMIVEIDGVANAGSSYWMLYTDSALSNTEWGTMEYEGETYASAMFGAGLLPIEEGCVYIWTYQTFSW